VQWPNETWRLAKFVENSYVLDNSKRSADDTYARGPKNQW